MPDFALGVFHGEKRFAEMAQHFEMAQQKCVQRFAVFDRSAVSPLRSLSPPNRASFFVRATVLVMPAHSRSKERRRFARLCRGHPRLDGTRQTKDVDGRNKSGHDDGLRLLEFHCRRRIVDPSPMEQTCRNP
jgi:hypothetical protein